MRYRLQKRDRRSKREKDKIEEGTKGKCGG
jgi:hypothetical protein